MKYVKMLGLAAVAAMALMAFAGSASATVLTSPAGTHYTGEIQASAESSLLLRAGFANITCTESSVAGKTENTGGPSETVRGPIEVLTFSSCNATVHVLKKGTLEVHTIGSGPNGTLTSSGAEATVATLGTSCTYGTANTHIGTLTGSKTTGGNATLHIEAKLNKTAGGFLCASPAAWEGNYVVTQPSYLDVS